MTHIKRIIIVILLVFPLLVFGAKRKYHVVRKGETLYSIARKNKTSVKTLKKLNKIRNEKKLYVGKRIYLPTYKKSSKKTYTKKKTTSKKLKIKLSQPVKGKILNKYNEGGNLVQKNGIEYSTSGKTHVRPAMSGTVQYTGNMRGYGNVVIIQHTWNVSTIYANLDNIRVRTGQKVNYKNTLGVTGKNGSNKYVLHFELLKNRKPINPQWYF